MSATHRIRRQRWQVRTASAADAFAVRATLRQESGLSLLQALESAFAAIDHGEREIHVPRLELAIRISSPEQLAEELPVKLAEAVRLSLVEAIDAAPQLPVKVVPGLAPGSRLRHYLRHGQVDWFDAEREPAELQQQLANEARPWGATPATAWPGLLAELPSGGQDSADAFFRFLQLLEAGQRQSWWDFATLLAAARDDESPTLLALLRQMAATLPADPALRLQALGLLALSADPARSRHHGSECWRAAQACAGQLETLAALDRTHWQKIESLLGGEAGPARGELPVGEAGVSIGVSKLPAPEASAWEEWPNSPATPATPATPASAASSASSVGTGLFGRDNAAEPALGIPLRSAGLVLLHPYLPRLFAELGWISASHPSDEPFPWARLPQAAALLNWLATGRDEPFEFELGTAKLLLGLKPDDALPVAAGLIGELEREEGAALLGAVVQHWSALGQTSVNGLRVAFLQRGGRLYPAPDGWLLRPQGESFDLLLDRLPWGLSIIRLPWMPGCLHTEWLSP